MSRRPSPLGCYDLASMAADISLVLVTFRSHAVAPAAVASFRDGARACDLASEVVIVDHSEDAEEAARLGSLAPERLLVLPNRGYAAGVNAGVAASRGGLVLVGNPDIVLKEGSVAALLAALREGWDIVGPQFHLGAFLLPPADLQTPADELRRWRAGRSRAGWTRYLTRESARWRSVWRARDPVALPALSGALLGFRRETFDRVGPWDEGYFLYFEEIDWLRRAGRAGLRAAQVPCARVEHLWGHAADPAAMAERIRASRRRFFRAHFPVRGRLVTALGPPRTPPRPQPFSATAGAATGGGDLWLLSPTALGFPAAAFAGSREEFVAAARELARAVARPGPYVVVALDPATGVLRGPWSWGSADG